MPTDSSTPVFLLASERSGTNLLRRRLSEAQQTLFGPAPLHILKHLYYSEPYYGDLNQEANFLSLVEDSLRLVYEHFSPWDTQLTATDVVDAYPSIFAGQRSVIGVMHVLYTLYAQENGYKSYFCKDNNLFDFVFAIRKQLPMARFLFLYRDPRDVVLSQLQRPTQVKSIHYLARLWQAEQIQCIRMHHELAGDGASKAVSYEELINSEEEVIQDLCEWLGIAASSNVTKTSSEKTDIQEWQNLDRPTISNNHSKFRSELSTRAIAKIEANTWHQMKWLGYTPEHQMRPKFSRSLSEMEILLAKALRSAQHRMKRQKLTAGQVQRQQAVKALQARWQ